MEITEVMLPGVTGFRNTIEDSGQQNNKEFETYLYEAIRTECGKLIEGELLTNNKNFYTYQIQNKEKKYYYILLHSIYPFVAFASVVDFSGIIFIDGPESIKSVFKPTYNVLPKDLLNQKLLEEHFKTLKEYEVKMIKYWRAETIGEVIYNYWD